MANFTTLVACTLLLVLGALGLDVASLAAKVAGTVIHELGAVTLEVASVTADVAGTSALEVLGTIVLGAVTLEVTSVTADVAGARLALELLLLLVHCGCGVVFGDPMDHSHRISCCV